ncbi:uncharacterized protein BDZ99DRAFT_540279 [Mytilinidion resinicola]|uniref:S-adenosyl-L-methionine-dependent methyltransferase n=1 Tax=Mytilinidion resinicola TaxID=574789 RepID=A0A6A6YA13_9PEZI|nr:uncharacterized protein BDZ99DRAFT_540279 [Mytilinidion resinicola]KAF2805662.1 hypothetical protein BDZ99DRAFT_540279 [Mytilinidion resinicola]
MSIDERALVEVEERVFQHYSVAHRIYCVPVDDDEENRLDIQYPIMKTLFGWGFNEGQSGRLWFPPITPRTVLDCGYGFGNWAIEVAQSYPTCQVRGVDIYPADLAAEPTNLTLQVHNLNRSLDDILEPGEPKFHLINSSFVGPGIHRGRWPYYVHDLKKLTARGGWVQMMEYSYFIQSDSGLLTPQHALSQWYAYYYQAMTMANGGDRDPAIGGQLRQLMTNAGFSNVQGQTYSLPIGGWREGMERIGRDNLDNIEELLNSQAIWPFTQLLGWSKATFDAFTARAMVEARDATLKPYIRV